MQVVCAQAQATKQITTFSQSPHVPDKTVDRNATVPTSVMESPIKQTTHKLALQLAVC